MNASELMQYENIDRAQLEALGKVKVHPRKGKRCHSWVSGGKPPAFLICTRCGIEHTMREKLGKVGGKPFYHRLPGGDWYPATAPIVGCIKKEEQ